MRKKTQKKDIQDRLNQAEAERNEAQAACRQAEADVVRLRKNEVGHKSLSFSAEM